MKHWSKRPKEEANLLNPAFCCIVLTSLVVGYSSVEKKGMPFPIAFLALPIVLHKSTREMLPRNIRTSLPAWLHENSFSKIQFYDRVNSLKPFVKEALLFGALHDWLVIKENGRIKAIKTESNIKSFLRKTVDESRDCISRAIYVGKWLASAGSTQTVMALWGIRP